jgi:hypothetical protein
MCAQSGRETPDRIGQAGCAGGWCAQPRLRRQRAGAYLLTCLLTSPDRLVHLARERVAGVLDGLLDVCAQRASAVAGAGLVGQVAPVAASARPPAWPSAERWRIVEPPVEEARARCCRARQ